ncbi:hypothetical protein PIB30_078439 [Stylosanthes scabra]|uniref:Uncharacterized protein n=1 Tax=Stylosanthes scabra TaxID=79078 RepID=A0ABU6XPE8_9FABA|nr:hypothetical protein [Stylosanthes scabra]
MSGRRRGNRRGVAASPASDGEQPDLSNDFAEIAAALRESAAAMRETNAARDFREQLIHPRRMIGLMRWRGHFVLNRFPRDSVWSLLRIFCKGMLSTDRKAFRGSWDETQML